MSDRPHGEPPEPDDDQPVVPEDEGEEGEGEEEDEQLPHVPDTRELPGGQPTGPG